MPATPGPPARSGQHDYIAGDGTWTDTTKLEEVSTEPVLMVLPDAGHLVPASRRAAEEGVTCAIVRASWKSGRAGNEIRGTLAAVLEIHPGKEPS